MRPTLRTRTLLVSLVAVLALGGLAACGSDSDSGSTATTEGSGELTVTDVWARESAMSAEFGAVYFVITNDTGAEDELLSASVPTSVAAEAQVHETTAATDDTEAMGDMTDSSMGGEPMMTMKEVESVAVPAGGTVTFEPGGYHVMLMELAGPLEAGTTIEVTLTFATAGEITVPAEVRAS